MKQNPTGLSLSQSKKETAIIDDSTNKKRIFPLIFLFLILFSLNYIFLDGKLQIFLSNPEKIQVMVERVIDGDTFKTENDTIRMLGINTPERNEKYYLEAKNFLNDKIANKSVKIEFGKEKKDLYGRTLAYVFLGNENINLGLVESGLANFYFPSGKDKNYGELKEAWEKCIEKNINLCEKSKDICRECVSLEDFDTKNQKVVLRNTCTFSCEITNWEIKDEGRKKFIFPKMFLESQKKINVITGNKSDYGENLFWKGEDYVWTRSGDTLFLRDEEGKLVLWKNY